MTLQSVVLVATDLFVIAGTLYIVSLILSGKRVSPPIPTRHAVVSDIVGAFGPLPSGSVFYDLGSGSGRMVFAMAKANPHARCIGVEKYLIPYLVSRVSALLYRVPNASFRKCDMFTEDYSDATHLYAYLYPHVMDGLLPKLVRELRRGTVLLSLDFPFSLRAPEKTVPLPGASKAAKQVFVYRF